MEFWLIVAALLGLGIVIAAWLMAIFFWCVAKFKKMRRQHEQRLREAQDERARLRDE